MNVCLHDIFCLSTGDSSPSQHCAVDTAGNIPLSVVTDQCTVITGDSSPSQHCAVDTAGNIPLSVVTDQCTVITGDSSPSQHCAVDTAGNIPLSVVTDQCTVITLDPPQGLASPTLYIWSVCSQVESDQMSVVIWLSWTWLD